MSEDRKTNNISHTNNCNICSARCKSAYIKTQLYINTLDGLNQYQRQTSSSMPRYDEGTEKVTEQKEKTYIKMLT